MFFIITSSSPLYSAIVQVFNYFQNLFYMLCDVLQTWITLNTDIVLHRVQVESTYQTIFFIIVSDIKRLQWIIWSLLEISWLSFWDHFPSQSSNVCCLIVLVNLSLTYLSFHSFLYSLTTLWNVRFRFIQEYI